MTDVTAQTVSFPDLISKPVVFAFDQEHSSSDGGALLLKAIDEELGVSEQLAGCLRDPRQRGKVRHGLQELLQQRLFGIALGYPDGNDATELADDPIHKMLVGRSPVDGDPLASPSTLSRFENAPGSVELYQMVETLADLVLARHRRRLSGRRVKSITLDFDPTVDPTHGQQAFSFYHGHYGTHCFLPMVGTIQFNEESKQRVLCSVLRPGDAGAALGLVPLLERLLPKIQTAFPKTRIRIRLDGGFGTPGVLDFLDDLAGVEYVVGLSNWAPLKKRAKAAEAEATRAHRKTGKTSQVFGETEYQTKKTWPHPRRVVYKAEVVDYPGRDPRSNLRFVVTNMKRTPKGVYRWYCKRGDAENRIKELKEGLSMDRTSCSSFMANQFRVQLTVAAYILFQELSHRARHTKWRNAQVSRLRDRILKFPAWVEESVRRAVVHLPTWITGDRDWQRMASAVGGIPC